MARGSFFRQLRIGLLLLLLAFVVIDVWVSRIRTHDWSERERVAVYPIAGDNSPVTMRHLQRLGDDDFVALERFFAREAARYAISTEQPVDFQLRHPIAARPPPPPDESGPVANAWWSIKLRWWVWQVTRDDPGPYARIRMFLIFHDPDRRSELPHSLGLRELLAGVAHVFADRRQKPVNDVVIAHELLHTLGATDKYDPATNLPLFPQGYAEPQRQPLYPQRFAELMGGRVPLSADRAEMPAGLGATRVGPLSAQEIAWSR